MLPDHRALDLAAAREATYIFHNEVTYEYPAPIRALHHQFVVLPRRRHGDQRRITHRVHADVPHRAAVRHRYDRFGNPVVEVRAAEVPERFSFGVRAVLHRSRDDADPTARGGPIHTRADPPDDRRPCARADAAAARSTAATTRVGAALAIGELVRSAMTYELGVTGVRTTAAEAWAAAARRVPGHGPRDDRHVPLPGIAGALRVRAPARRGRQPRLGRGRDGRRTARWRTTRRTPGRPTCATSPSPSAATTATSRPTAGSYRSGPRGRMTVRKRVAVSAVR